MASRILIVEDDEATVELIKFTLASKGFEAIVASDGAEAMRAVRKEKPDLIVLDIMLPTMDGFQVCMLLKHNVEYRDIPIIILSAKVRKEDISEGYEKGADEYITKPFEPSHLIERIKFFLKKGEKI